MHTNLVLEQFLYYLQSELPPNPDPVPAMRVVVQDKDDTYWSYATGKWRRIQPWSPDVGMTRVYLDGRSIWAGENDISTINSRGVALAKMLQEAMSNRRMKAGQELMWDMNDILMQMMKFVLYIRPKGTKALYGYTVAGDWMRLPDGMEPPVTMDTIGGFYFDLFCHKEFLGVPEELVSSFLEYYNRR